MLHKYKLSLIRPFENSYRQILLLTPWLILVFNASMNGTMAIDKSLIYEPMLAWRYFELILLSNPIACATSDISAPVASQIALTEFILDTFWAKKALEACKSYYNFMLLGVTLVCKAIPIKK